MASSSANIPQMIQDGHFREDLYYRLNVVPIQVPALQERVTDIPDLFHHFMTQSAMAHGYPPRRLTEEAMVILQSYSWPGNVRQLKNVVEWILIMASGDPRDDIRAEMLPPEVRSDTSLASSSQAHNIVILPLREARELFEREYLLAQVNRFGGNISKTARFVGMERSALHRKLRALGVHEGRYQEDEVPAEHPNPELKIA